MLPLSLTRTYTTHFGDNTLPHPLLVAHPLLVEPYERLYLDVAQRMTTAFQDDKETQLRLVVSNTDETGKRGSHYFTVGYKIVKRNVE